MRGKMPKDQNKTQPTDSPVSVFLATIPARRKAEAEQLIQTMQAITGEPPVLWGPSIIGFGQQHYRYESGREGDMPRLAFSPRKAKLTIYFNEGFERYGEDLAKLGRHQTSVACLYLNKLSDADPAVLEKMLRESYQAQTEPESKPASVEEYLNQIPPQARQLFEALRQRIKHNLPEANEVLSYGMLGYKTDAKRARVYISAWKDHLGLYPAPKAPELQDALAPYLRGKGTLWFPLDQPLPFELIDQVVEALR